MKTGPSMPGALRKALGLITKNWGLKLLSLLLAVIIYHSLKTESGNLGVREKNDRQSIQPGQ